MTDLDVVREYQATKFYRLLEDGGDPNSEVTEVDSGDAFEKGVAEWEKPDEEPEAKDKTDDDFEKLQ